MNKSRKQNHLLLSDLKSEARKQLKSIVIARLEIIPSYLRLSVGESEYSREDVIAHVQEEDSIGKQVMVAQLQFIQDLARGNIYKDGQDSIDYQAES